jgi:hypothetical protein
MYLNASILMIKMADKEKIEVAMDYGIIAENGSLILFAFLEGVNHEGT